MLQRVLILGGTTEARAARRPARRVAHRSSTSRCRSPAARASRCSTRCRSGSAASAAREGLADYLARAADRPPDRRHASLRRADLAPMRRWRPPRPGVPFFALCRPPGSRPTATAGPSRLGRATRSAALGDDAAPGVPGARPAGAGAASAPRRSTPIWSAASIRSIRRSTFPMPRYILARGPFAESRRARAACRRHGIDAIVAKNSGGDATYGKIAAARDLGIEVVLVRRPERRRRRDRRQRRGGVAAGRSSAASCGEARRVDQRRPSAALDDPRLGRADDDAGRHVGACRIGLAERHAVDALVGPAGGAAEDHRRRAPADSRAGIRRPGRAARAAPC